jgi:endonuclease/exonuclease/phosphatase family metal-dependent hydrolase
VTTPGGTGGVLRVATANAASGRDRHGRTSAAGWAAWAVAAAELDIDLLAVQEVDHLLPRTDAVDQTAVLADALAGDGEPWHARFAAAIHGTPGSAETFRPAGSTDPDEPSYGVALASRHPVTSWSELRLAPGRAQLPVALPPGAGRRVLWVPDEPRVALAAVVETPIGTVSVVTTHLSFSPVRAVRQLREVQRWCRRLPRPLVLMGDLNLPGRVAVPLSGWTSVAKVPTFPAAGPRVQLDHVLVDGVVGIGATERHRLADSDHLALSAELAGR